MKIAERCWGELTSLPPAGKQSFLLLWFCWLITLNSYKYFMQFYPACAQTIFPDWTESLLVSTFFQMCSLCLIKYTISSSDPNAMFAHYFEFFFLTDSFSLAVLFLGMFVCIFLAFFDTCHSYKMPLMNHNNPLCIFSLLRLCGKPNI